MGLNYGKKFRTSGPPIPLDGVERQAAEKFNPLRHFAVARQRIKAASTASGKVDLSALEALLSEAWALAQADLRAGRKPLDAVGWDARVRRENEQLLEALTLLKAGEKARAAGVIAPRRRHRRLSGPLRITKPTQAKPAEGEREAPATPGEDGQPDEAPAVRRAGLGDWVVVRLASGGHRQRFRIAPTPTSRPTATTVLATSPIGLALFESAVGDTIPLPLPNGAATATVVSISEN